MKKIDISTRTIRNVFVIVDDEDYKRVNAEGKWRLYGKSVIRKPYVPKGKRSYIIYLNQFIMKTDYSILHKDLDILNCQKSNLKIDKNNLIIYNNFYLTEKMVLNQLEKLEPYYSEHKIKTIKNKLGKIFYNIRELIIIFGSYGIKIDLDINFNIKLDNFFDLNESDINLKLNKEKYENSKITDALEIEVLKMKTDDYGLGQINEKIIPKLKKIFCYYNSYIYNLINYILIFGRTIKNLTFVSDKNFGKFSRDKRSPFSEINERKFETTGVRKIWIKKKE